MGRKTGQTKQCRQCGNDYYIQKCRAATSKWCSKHCARVARMGSDDLTEAFWSKVDKSAGPEGCWPYTGFRKWDGYGWLARKMNGRWRWFTAHRYAWLVTHGSEPERGLHILHRCDNPPCCNPAHLFAGTHQENMADKVAKKRFGRLFPGRVRPVRKEMA